MRKAKVYNFNVYAGELSEVKRDKQYLFTYNDTYSGPPVSLTMPVNKKQFEYDRFPPFFEGLLPEGMQLEAIIRQTKTDRNDFFSILMITGKDLAGSVTVEEIE